MVKVRRKTKIVYNKLLPRPVHGYQYLDVLREDGGWMSAAEVGARCGVAWQKVIFWLNKQAELGLLEWVVVDHPGSARTIEQSKLFRSRPMQGEIKRVETTLPAWLAPQAIVAIGELRRVDGTAGMRRTRQVNGQSRGGPGGPLNGAASEKPASAPVSSTVDAEAD
jgi:hypothetical protein